MTASITITLTDDQLLLLAERVAAILAAGTPAAPVDPLVTVDAAAGMLGVTTKTVRNMLSDGRLTRHGAPRRPLVARVEVEALRGPTGGRTRRRARAASPAAAGRLSRLAREVG